MSEYLLVPAMPTPNGSLHLGHISGPYLRMDVLARHLRRTNHKVTIISASDGWETHVLPRSRSLGISPNAVCEKFHQVIENCFARLNIEYDKFVNPLDVNYSERAKAIYRDVLKVMAENGQIYFRSEKVPYSLKYKQAILGSDIGGECPQCHVKDLAGFYCEDCGVEASPEDLIGPWSELPQDEWEWRDYRSAFIKVSDSTKLRKELEKRCADHSLIDLAFKSLDLNKGYTRLTHPGNWGVTADHPEVTTPDSVIFSYPGMYCLSLLCGEIAAEELGCSANPFAADSDVILVKSFGYDNTAPYLLAATSIGLYSQKWRAFDHYLTNYFANLDGRKFSTSANHAIWAHEALQNLDASADTVRAYLCLVNPQFEIKDFSMVGFREFRDKWDRRLTTLLNQNLEKDHPLDEVESTTLVHLFEQQKHYLNPGKFDLSQAFNTLETWLELGMAKGGGRSWGLAFAVLSYPFIPEISNGIIRRCINARKLAITNNISPVGWGDIEQSLDYLISRNR